MRPSIACLAALAAVSLSSLASAAPTTQALTFRKKAEYRSEWPGHNLLPPTAWVGERVTWNAPPGVDPTPDYRPPVHNGGGSSGSGLHVTDGQPMRVVTHLLTANRVTTVSTHARAGQWRPATALSRDTWSNPNLDGTDRDLYHYAEVVDGRGNVLANASGYSDTYTSLSDDRFSAGGSFSASTTVTPGTRPLAHAVATHAVTAFFRVDELTGYDLVVNMALAGEAQLGFTLMRWSDRSTVLRFGRNYLGVGDGEAVTRTYEGVIQPGVYRLAVTARTLSKLNALGQVVREGGEADFGVTMTFDRKPGTSGGLFGVANAGLTAAPLHAMSFAAPTAIPEPASAGLLAAAAGFLLPRRRPR